MTDLLMRCIITLALGATAVILFGSAWALAKSRQKWDRPFAFVPALLAGVVILLAVKVWR